MKTSVLVLGNHRQTLIATRSLAAAGFRVVIGRQAKTAYSAHSRFVSEVWDHPPFRMDEEFVDSLVEFLRKRLDILYVFPIGEAELDCLARHVAQVPDHSRVVMPEPSVVRACLNKAETYQIVSRLAIPLPRGECVNSLSALVKAASSIGYPVIVKPRSGFQQFYERKAIFCRMESELVSSFAVWPQADEAVIVQKFFIGTRYNCEFAAIDGRLLIYFEHKVVRSERSDDIGSEVEGVTVKPTAILQHYCERLLLELKYSGIGCVQFLVDEPQGKVCFLEVNPRLDGSCAFPWHYGFDLPALAVDIASGQRKANPPAVVVLPHYPVGKRIHWCYGDIQGLIDALKSGEVKFGGALHWVWNILKSTLRANCHMTWWWKDPVPTLILYQRVLSTLWRRVKKTFISGILFW